MTESLQTFGVIGAGAWGTALAISLHRAGRQVRIWSRNAATAEAINYTRENFSHLPGVMLDPAITATVDIADLAACDAYVMATPSQASRSVFAQMAQRLGPAGAPVVLTAKGIELGTTKLLSEVAAEELPGRAVAILSGPSFASEVAKGLPTALTLAITDLSLGERLRSSMHSPSFRLYLTDDVIGAQLGGAVKNVLAIACGVIEGRKLGDNARAALITRGLAEIMRLAAALGGRAETLMGLAGLGDLALTCSSKQSRNMSLGISLGEGRSLADVLATQAGVTEGVATASAALALAKKHGVDMPIIAAVDQVLNRQADIVTVINSLLNRPLRGAGS